VQGAVPLRISGFAKDDLRKLVLATQTHCTEAAPQALTFTEIWTREYDSRFAPTVFVPLEPGERLQNGRIEIVAQIATGGLSAVYLANAEGRRVAVKEAVATGQTSDCVREKAIELFHREARLLKGLSHPRISQVLESFSENDRHYIVMQYLAGVDLRTFIKDNGRQHEEVALRWALEVADVLVYLHSRIPPVVHRDLTPDNMIFTADGAIAIIDFGAANTFVAQATGTLVGKQSYIPPEQFRGRATPQSDLYALGCSLYFLLTGCDPEPMSQSHPRAVNESVSELTDALVARATALDLNDRYESAQAFMASIKATITNLRRANNQVKL
jgi:serine/threonine-protein kinase